MRLDGGGLASHVSGTSTGSNAQHARRVPGRCCSARSKVAPPSEWPAARAGGPPMAATAAKTSSVNQWRSTGIRSCACWDAPWPRKSSPKQWNVSRRWGTTVAHIPALSPLPCVSSSAGPSPPRSCRAACSPSSSRSWRMSIAEPRRYGADARRCDRRRPPPAPLDWTEPPARSKAAGVPRRGTPPRIPGRGQDGLRVQPEGSGTHRAGRSVHGGARLPARTGAPRLRHGAGEPVEAATGRRGAEGQGEAGGHLELVPAGRVRRLESRAGRTSSSRRWPRSWAASRGRSRCSTARRPTAGTWRCWPSSAPPSSRTSGCGRCWRARSARPTP